MVVTEQTAPAIPPNPQASTPATTAPDGKSLYVMVTTLEMKGKVIGERVVDMYHYGTRKWLHDHMWWASHNTHRVEIEPASPTDVDAYLAAQRQKLADKFNTPKTIAA